MCWNSNQAKTLLGTWTHMAKTQTQSNSTVSKIRSHTWFQDLMKLKFLMSHHRKNSVSDKVIGKKWTYLERNTLHRQSVEHLRGWVWSLEMGWLVFMDWVISYAKWEPYSNCFGERLEISRNWATAHLLVFWWCLGTALAPLGVSFSLLIEDQGLVRGWLFCHLGPIWF